MEEPVKKVRASRLPTGRNHPVFAIRRNHFANILAFFAADGAIEPHAALFCGIFHLI
jgi:hypothetical protein